MALLPRVRNSIPAWWPLLHRVWYEEALSAVAGALYGCVGSDARALLRRATASALLQNRDCKTRRNESALVSKPATMAAAAASSAGASRSSKQSVVNGLTFVKNSSYTITQKERHHKESGSAFDASRPAKSLRVREHESRKLGPSDAAAFSKHIKTSKPEPKSEHKLATSCAWRMQT